MENLGKDYWKVCPRPPYSPSEDDVEYFKHFIQNGTTLVLGCTHALLPISTHQMDIDPWFDGPNVIVRDWRENTQYFDNMIGDGVLNFTQELTDSVIEMASKCTKNLIVRSFRNKLPKMLIANYFPTHNDFKIQPSTILQKEHCNFFVWNF
mgnify:CR=1 FL=1